MKKLIWIFFVLAILFSGTTITYAWNQNTHMQINSEAFKAFIKDFSNSEKFKNSKIDFQQKFKGNAVLESGMVNIKTGDLDKTIQAWVVHGGFSADEPNIYASFRHFFDPVMNTGNYYLTDIIGDGDLNPNIDARWWGISHPDNPFSLKKGLEYYKRAMEIPEGTVDGFLKIPVTSEREGEAKTFTSDEELRSYYTAKAFRSLGETMHMLADMTQPAHVRNDGHPISEPIEDTITAKLVAGLADKKTVSLISFQGSTKELFYNLAKFTNSNFYSADTIYDEKENVLPANGFKPYNSPQFKDMAREKGNIKFKNIEGIEVPMVAKTLSSYVYGIDEAESYMIPAVFSKKQAEVLIPIAIRGNKKLAEGFFPTLNLELAYDSGLANVQGKGTISAYRLTGKMKHEAEKDALWKENELKISFSGEGKILRQQGNTKEVLAYVAFLNGELNGLKLNEKDDYKHVDPLVVLLDDGTKSTESYLVGKGNDEFFIEISCGGRLITSNTVSFKVPELQIEPTAANIEEGNSVSFSASVLNGPETPYFKWYFSDVASGAQGEQANISHDFDRSGQFEAIVSLYDEKDKSKILAQKKAIISVSRKPDDAIQNNTVKSEDKQEPEVPMSVPTTKPKTAVEEYDYNAALAVWKADFAAEVNSRRYDDGVCKSTSEFEWVMQPIIRDGQVIGASRIWQTNSFYAGEHAGRTIRQTVNEAYDPANPGPYISLGDLRQKYPQFMRIINE